MHKLIKTLEIKNWKNVNFVSTKNSILSCVFLFFLIIDSYFLILAVFAQFFNPVAELVISIGIPTNEEKVKIR